MTSQIWRQDVSFSVKIFCWISDFFVGYIYIGLLRSGRPARRLSLQTTEETRSDLWLAMLFWSEMMKLQCGAGVVTASLGSVSRHRSLDIRDTAQHNQPIIWYINIIAWVQFSIFKTKMWHLLYKPIKVSQYCRWSFLFTLAIMLLKQLKACAWRGINITSRGDIDAMVSDQILTPEIIFSLPYPLPIKHFTLPTLDTQQGDREEQSWDCS